MSSKNLTPPLEDHRMEHVGPDPAADLQHRRGRLRAVDDLAGGERDSVEVLRPVLGGHPLAGSRLSNRAQARALRASPSHPLYEYLLRDLLVHGEGRLADLEDDRRLFLDEPDRAPWHEPHRAQLRQARREPRRHEGDAPPPLPARGPTGGRREASGRAGTWRNSPLAGSACRPASSWDGRGRRRRSRSPGARGCARTRTRAESPPGPQVEDVHEKAAGEPEPPHDPRAHSSPVWVRAISSPAIFKCPSRTRWSRSERGSGSSVTASASARRVFPSSRRVQICSRISSSFCFLTCSSSPCGGKAQP